MNIALFSKVIHTARYHKPEQLYWFVHYRTRRFLPVWFWFHRRKLPELKIDIKSLKRYIKYAQNWASVEEDLTPKVKNILSGIWEYAGEKIPLDLLSKKKRITLSPLAMYGLHSFEFLWQICLAQLQYPNSQYSIFAKECILQWIKNYPPGTSLAWDPYPTSYRIRYWILAMHLWKRDDEEILNSLAIQTKYLSKSIEYHLKANHLIQNLCGLIVSSITLFPSELPYLLQQLEEELKEQILDDGGHYERVPMYHVHVLLDLLGVLAVLEEPPDRLKNAIRKMVDFLTKLTLSDGNIPLLGDSVYGHLPSPGKVLQVALKYIPTEKENLPKKFISLPQSGYYIYKKVDSPCLDILIRAGDPGPPYQLAHAHCDQFNYELLLQKQRVIVDSGMHGYGGSPYRSFQRSTRAHNTVYIEGEEQLECWNTFRVARRGKMLWTFWEPYQEGQLFAGKFQYYSGITHSRAIYIIPDKGFLCWDFVETQGKKAIYSLIHLHPSTDVKVINSYVLLECGKIKISFYPFENEVIEIISGCHSPQQGWYSESFGTAMPNPVIVLKKTSKTKTLTQMGYWISFSDDETKYPKGTIPQWVEEIGNKILKQKL